MPTLWHTLWYGLLVHGTTTNQLQGPLDLGFLLRPARLVSPLLLFSRSSIVVEVHAWQDLHVFLHANVPELGLRLLRQVIDDVTMPLVRRVVPGDKPSLKHCLWHEVIRVIIVHHLLVAVQVVIVVVILLVLIAIVPVVVALFVHVLGHHAALHELFFLGADLFAAVVNAAVIILIIVNFYIIVLVIVILMIVILIIRSDLNISWWLGLLLLRLLLRYEGNSDLSRHHRGIYRLLLLLGLGSGLRHSCVLALVAVRNDRGSSVLLGVVGSICVVVLLLFTIVSLGLTATAPSWVNLDAWAHFFDKVWHCWLVVVGCLHRSI